MTLRRRFGRLGVVGLVLVAATGLAARPALASIGPGTTSSVAQVSVGQHDAAGWSPLSLPVLATEPSGTLTAVSCLSGSSCVGVGYSRSPQGVYVTLVERWDGNVWSIEPSVDPDGSSNAFLTAVRCFGPALCLAVGDYVQPSGRQVAFAERWEGHRWALESVPNPTDQSMTFLTSLSCASADACSAVGYARSANTSYIAAAYSWNGSTWQPRPVPVPGPTSQFTSVSCASPTDCVAVGFSAGTYWLAGQPIAAHWDGVTWSNTTPAPIPGADTGGFSSVSCPSATECLAVGAWIGPNKTSGATAERWDGSTWVAQSTPTGRQDQLRTISCSSLTACIALGDSSSPTVIIQWDGSTWAPLPSSPIPDVALSCTATTACSTVGGTDGHAATARWDGTTWTTHAISYRSGATYSNLHSVSCVSSVECVAVGEYLTTTGKRQALIERWNGDHWQKENAPLSDGSGLFEVSCVSIQQCTAVGYTPTTGGFGNNTATVALHSNATTWTSEPTPTVPWPHSELTHLSCTRTGTDGQLDHPTVCTAIGRGLDDSGNKSSIVERWNGSTWQLQNLAVPTGGSVELSSISCPTTTECHSVGKVYIDPPCSLCTGDPTQQPPLGPCSLGCFADQHWDGQGWTYQLMQSTPKSTDRGSSEQIDGVSCPWQGTCVAVGFFASTSTFAQHLTVGSWALQPTPDPSGYSAVSCPNVTSCTSVGLEGELATHWDGSQWSAQPIRNPAGANTVDLNSVSCPTAHMCMTVGGQYRASTANSDIGPQLALAERYTDWHH